MGALVTALCMVLVQDDLDAAAARALPRRQESSASEVARTEEHADASLPYKRLFPVYQSPAIPTHSSSSRHQQYNNATRFNSDAGVVNIRAYNLSTESGSNIHTNNCASSMIAAASVDTHIIHCNGDLSNPAAVTSNGTEEVAVHKATAMPEQLAPSALVQKGKDLHGGESSRAEQSRVPARTRTWPYNSVTEMETPLPSPPVMVRNLRAVIKLNNICLR